MVALQVKQICMYLELASRLTKNHQYKIRLRRRLTQTLVFPKFSWIYGNTWCLNFLRNIVMKKAITALSLCQRLWLKLDQMTESRARESVNAIGSNFGAYAYTYLVF